MPMCQSSALTRWSHSEVNVTHGAQPDIVQVMNESWVRSESKSGEDCLNLRLVEEQGKDLLLIMLSQNGISNVR